MFQIKRGVLLIGVLSSVIAIATSGNALAAVAQDSDVSAKVCETGTFYNTSQTGRYVGNGDSRVYGQSGGTLSISSGKTITVSGQLQTTASVEAGVIFSKVAASVQVSVGLSKAVTTTVGYSWTVPANQPSGWIEMGAHGYQIDWSKGYYRTPCIWNQTGSGRLLGTTGNSSFAHS